MTQEVPETVTGVDEAIEAEQPRADDTSDGTTAPKPDPEVLAAHQPDADLEPADDTPAEAGDDTAVDHEGNELAQGDE